MFNFIVKSTRCATHSRNFISDIQHRIMRVTSFVVLKRLHYMDKSSPIVIMTG